MFKYLAGIFANPDNYYVDGRLATPFTPISPSKKVPPGSHQQQNGQTKRSQKATRPPPKTPKYQQVLDPVTYIVDVLESSSSNDENESIKPPLLQLPRPISSSSTVNPPLEHRLHECWSSFLQTEIPDAPPVSPIQSSMSLNAADSSSRDNGATNWDQLPYASEEHLCGDFGPQKYTNDWELAAWLPEEFWSIKTDPVIVYK